MDTQKIYRRYTMVYPNAGDWILMETLFSYHIKDFQVIKDGVYWMVYKNSHLVGDLRRGLGEPKYFTTSSKVARYINTITKKTTVTYKDILSVLETGILRPLQREQNNMKWESNKKAFAQDFQQLLHRYGMSMKIDCDGEEWRDYVLRGSVGCDGYQESFEDIIC